MWPFTKPEPDAREPSEAAVAIAKSIETEPERWGIGAKMDLLVHRESMIAVNTDDNWICQPWHSNEPAANEPLIEAAVQKWIVARLSMPAKAKEPASE